jgi:adenosine deaminase
MEMVKEGKDQDARTLFNSNIYPNFEKYFKNEKESEPKALDKKIFFYELDEYLNNEGAKILLQTSREKILDLYLSYLEDKKTATNPDGCK